MSEKPKQHAEDERQRIEREEDEVTVKFRRELPGQRPAVL